MAFCSKVHPDHGWQSEHKGFKWYQMQTLWYWHNTASERRWQVPQRTQEPSKCRDDWPVYSCNTLKRWWGYLHDRSGDSSHARCRSELPKDASRCSRSLGHSCQPN